ncbi:Adenosylhopane nucleosidase, HpnG [Fimbriiglobus ruber]|uniref:Adenosylhopane nucleosidase, HpnG n=1 Tax=Fimbriiglobus ruber TaxID=1908690 RepID=A0A225E908_9BACT|nr:Adenosylhopane nucleosidase, HpnG [Fimbriiglobus ruber]
MSGADTVASVVVLFALEREAAPFRRAVRDNDRVRVVITGIGRAAAAETIEKVLSGPLPQLVVMAGFCGGLRPGLAVGDVVAPAEVVDEASGRWACAGNGSGRLLTTTRIVATPSDKRSLGERHRADIVDMESAAVADVCARVGVPFRAVRAVSDTVETALSPALVRLLASGNVSPFRACLALFRTPSLLGEFLRLARDTALAARQLAPALVEVIRPPCSG